MSAVIKANWYAPTRTSPITGGDEINLGEVRLDAGDADVFADQLSLILDLDPARNRPSVPFCGITITGTINELQELVDYLQTGIDINRQYFVDHTCNSVNPTTIDECPGCKAEAAPDHSDEDSVNGTLGNQYRANRAAAKAADPSQSYGDGE